METVSALLALCMGNPLLTGAPPLQMASKVELWYLWWEPELIAEQKLEWQLIWDTRTLMWHHCNDLNCAVWVQGLNSTLTPFYFNACLAAIFRENASQSTIPMSRMQTVCLQLGGHSEDTPVDTAMSRKYNICCTAVLHWYKQRSTFLTYWNSVMHIYIQ